MRCDDVIARLTAYVDGDLDDAAGSAVRGHLRTCDACRAAATDELAVRDAVARLPSPDVPRELWSGISARLAEQEVADSKRSRWWLWWQAARPKMVPALLVAAATTLAVTAVVKSRSERAEQPPVVANPPTPRGADPDHDVTAIVPAPGRSVGFDCDLHARSTEGDATATLAGMGPAIERCYQAAADELLAIVDADRPGWPARRAAEFASELAAAQRAIAAAPSGRSRERAWQSVIRLLQRAVTVPVVAEVTR